MKTCSECGQSFIEQSPRSDAAIAAGSQAASAAIIGRVVDGKYRILERIGYGGICIIYRAQHISLPRLVALKVLSSDASTYEQRQRFLREARAMVDLDHPDVVQIHDVGDDPHVGLYMALHFMAGDDLGERLTRDGALPIQHTWAIMESVCRALKAAHGSGIIHRDIKPHNIFLELDATAAVGFRAQLIDFGIAAMLAGSARHRVSNSNFKLTAIGTVVGSADTMSPEAATGQQVDHRADIFSVGVCLYTMLTGSPPHSGKSGAEMLFRRVSGPPRPPSMQPGAAWIPRSLDKLVLSMLSMGAEGRPQSAQVVLDQMGRIKSEVEQAWAEEFLGDPSVTRPSDWETTATRPLNLSELRRTCRVLVADDEPAIIDLVRLILQRGNIEVETAVGGHAALAKIGPSDGASMFDELVFDAMVFSLMMPSLDGIRCAGQVRQKGFSGPIFLLTAATGGRLRSQVEAMANVWLVDMTWQLHLLPDLVREALQAQGAGTGE